VLRLALRLGLALAEPAEEPVPPPTPIVLHWSAPRECPDREAFVAAMTSVAGRTLRLSDDADLTVDGRVERSSHGYVLQLRMRSGGDEERRDLQAPECEALVSAGSLVVATRLLAAVPPPPEEPPAAPGETAEDEPPAPVSRASEPSTPAAEASPIDDDALELEPPAPPPSPARSRRPPLGITVAALGGAALGAGPRLAATVRVGVGLRWSSARLDAFARHAFATATGGDDVPGVRVSLTGAGVLGCWAPGRGRLDVPLCAGLELGATVGRGIGPLASTDTIRQLWIGLPLEAGLAWAPIPRLALRALLGGTVALRRPGFHVDAGSDRLALVRPWPVGLHALGGLELRLP
jgi:hypothetical protein